MTQPPCSVLHAVSEVQHSVNIIQMYCGYEVDGICISAVAREVCGAIRRTVGLINRGVAPLDISGPAVAECGTVKVEDGRAVLPVALVAEQHRVELLVNIVVDTFCDGFTLRARSTIARIAPLPQTAEGEGF